MNDINKPNKTRHITLSTNSTATTVEKNLSKLNIKSVTTTFKRIRYLINTKPNNNNLQPEVGNYSINCKNC